MNNSSFSISLLHPRYLHTWLGVGVLWLLVNILPLKVLHMLGNPIGLLVGGLSKKRRRITRKNIEMCFPEKSIQEHEDIYKKSMQATGRAIFETSAAWFLPQWRLKKMYCIEGLEHLEKLKSEGRGALFLGLHFTTLDICGALINLSTSVDSFYRPNKNKAFDYIQLKGRQRFDKERRAIPRKDVRGIVKKLKQGRIIIYAADQDYGAKHSVFVPFFNIPTATITATSSLARLGKACVLPYSNAWNSDKGIYEITIYPPLENFPSDDDVADATRINQFVEQQVRKHPEQYLWSHRRFKTRPDGEVDFYNVETERYLKKRNRL